MTGGFAFVVPGGIDDPDAPSGGNVYDRRLARALVAAGRPVQEIAAPGAWPRPDAEDRAGLGRSLDALPDGTVVLLDGLVACGVPDVVVPHASRLRLAVLVHMPLVDEGDAHLDALERATLRAAAAVVATSPWAMKRLIRHHGLDPARVHAVTPGVDPAPLAAGTDGASRLLCVASVTPRKGHDVLVEALARVAGLPWSCVCAGPLHRDAAHVERVRGLIARHRLGDRVHLAGPLTGPRLAAAHDAADLAVLPTRSETYGMVVTEALAHGTPVLASDVDGVPGALGRAPDGTAPGLLVPPADPGALAAALRRWLLDPGLRDRLRTAARRRRGEPAGWDDASRRMAAVLDGLAEPTTRR
ncbi:glycosyltransferase family 4 protein [Actinomadura verrucosospora]|uniref:Group 1 glycosyl transferase protein n=1 Tax=Actinomadura verrucosospora TaxID=46165 RepID=A0A7D3VWU5_ACTVE|nr:glycosyltransferase family 4 protein [Actinomadura verrucosospora]QKG20911.1 group 1 glycosyl transferase protein [Actinomadura verrucosospora]